ncbi:MAG: hypothetical protein Q8L73_11810 [Methylotenera sp.]|nr:hypothetical protein [Methylotenera sp.]
MKNLLPRSTRFSDNSNSLLVTLTPSDIKRIILATHMFSVQFKGQLFASRLLDANVINHLFDHDIDCSQLKDNLDTYIKEIFDDIEQRLISALDVVEVH